LADQPRPANPYARSKAQSEDALQDALNGTRTSFTILRPPMVYGRDAPGNFHRLVRLVRSGLPLPLGGATEPRAFIAVQNLASAIIACAASEAAANQTYLVCDREQTSTRDFVRLMAVALERRQWTIPAPRMAALALASLIGQREAAERLFDPLEIDQREIELQLGWTPPWPQSKALADALRPLARGQAD
jgi:nucleoside-diphosphate-sugar epimerase